MQKIFLVGYMGSGKTTIGKNLARRLHWQFIDLDLFIENRYRKKIGEIFAEKGESEFRELERKALQEIGQFENVVVSTGGGTPCFFDNMEWMNRLGYTIYLQVPVDDLVKRLENCKHNRPLVKDKNWEEIKQFVAENLNKREEYYNQAAFIFNAENLVKQQDIEIIVNHLMLNIQKVKL
jgi:shikimate kinase